MLEAKRCRVQRLALERGDGGGNFRRHRPRQLSAAAVNRITDQRVAARTHVNADLMRAPGLEGAGDLRRERPEDRDRREIGLRILPAAADDCHLLAEIGRAHV